MSIPFETVAAKIAAMENGQAPNLRKALEAAPRLIELMRWLQFRSLRPQGIDGVAADLLKEFPDRIGTPTMHRNPQAEGREIRRDVPGESDRATWRWMLPDELFHEGSCDSIREYIDRQSGRFFFDFCLRAAQSELPWRLESFCADPDKTLADPFWFHDLRGALFDLMDAQAERERQTIAETEAVRLIFRDLKFAYDGKHMVRIIGDSRNGKTEAVKAFCAMHPGKARMVKTPDTCDERSWLNALADAVGASRGLEIPTAKLRATLEFILRHCGLMFVFDEAAWLIPSRWTNKTTPVRLNYIRSQILDHGCPVALIETPQFKTLNRFLKSTGYAMAQWEGRIMRTTTLPEPPEQDLYAIVKIHFPQLERKAAKDIVGVAMMTNNFLFAVEKIACNARAIAREDGRETLTDADVTAGIKLAGFQTPQIQPSLTPPQEGATAAAAAKHGRPRKNVPLPDSETPAPARAALEFPGRETSPVLQDV